MASWNPSDSCPAGVFSNNNLTYTYGSSGGQYATIHGTPAENATKWQWEFTFTSGTAADNHAVGITQPGTSIVVGHKLGDAAGEWAYFMNGNVNNAGAAVPPAGPTYVNNDVIGILTDLTNGLLWFTKNGVAITGNPTLGTGGYAIPTGVSWLPAATFNGQTTTVVGTANFASPFAFPVNGFAPWGQIVTVPRLMVLHYYEA